MVYWVLEKSSLYGRLWYRGGNYSYMVTDEVMMERATTLLLDGK
jgi:hypothetical protein